MKEIVSLVEANGKLLTDIQIKQIESKIEVRSLLTDEQKVIYNSHSGQRKRSRFIAQHRRTSKVRAERMDRMERHYR